MNPYIYHVDVKFDIPKANLPEALVPILKPEDQGKYWRLGEHVKIGVETKTPPCQSVIREEVRRDWPGAHRITIYDGHEFFLPERGTYRM